MQGCINTQSEQQHTIQYIMPDYVQYTLEQTLRYSYVA